MKRSTVERILDVQDKIRNDQALMDEYETRQAAFLAVLSELPQDQQDILLDYLGVGIEIHLRMLELCLKTE